MNKLKTIKKHEYISIYALTPIPKVIALACTKKLSQALTESRTNKHQAWIMAWLDTKSLQTSEIPAGHQIGSVPINTNYFSILCCKYTNDFSMLIISRMMYMVSSRYTSFLRSLINSSFLAFSDSSFSIFCKSTGKLLITRP